MWGLGGMQMASRGAAGDSEGAGAQRNIWGHWEMWGILGALGDIRGPWAPRVTPGGPLGYTGGGTWVVPDSTPLCSPRCSICRGQGWGQRGRGPR